MERGEGSRRIEPVVTDDPKPVRKGFDDEPESVPIFRFQSPNRQSHISRQFGSL
jgi:hypothetical protein